MSGRQPAADGIPTHPSRWWAVLARTLVFAALWWVLVEGEPGGWPLAALSISATVWASLALLPAGHWRWHLGGLIRFVPFFLWHSVVAGFDVARRALHPGLPIQPAETSYPLRLPAGPARSFFTGVISLFPGTLSTELQDEHIRLHTLDERQPVARTLRQLEARVADLFGVDL